MANFDKWLQPEDTVSFEKILRDKPHKEFEERKDGRQRKNKNKKRRAARREHED